MYNINNIYIIIWLLPQAVCYIYIYIYTQQILLGTSKGCIINPYYKNDVNNSDTKVENIFDNND